MNSLEILQEVYGKDKWWSQSELTSLYRVIELTRQNEKIRQMDKMQELRILVVQDCADYVRRTYDHQAAESIAWGMEVEYGLHGDYA